MKVPAKRLPENLDQFRAFMDSSPIFVWAKDADGRYVYINKTYESLFGARVADWLDKTDFDIWSAESAERFRRNDLQVLEQQQTLNDVETLSESDGGHSYLVCKFPFTDSEGNAFVGGIGVDISEQKRLEAELRESRQRFRILSDLALEAVVLHDSQRVVDANAIAPQLLGYEREELLQCPPARLLPPELLDQGGQESGTFEAVATRKDGSRFPVEVSSRKISPAGGSLWVTILRDLTERKRAEQALRDSEERMRLAQDAAGIGHFDWNLQTGETAWSDSLKRMLASEPTASTSLLDKLQGIHPDDRPAFQAQLESVIAGTSSKIRISYRSWAVDGSPCWRICEARGYADASGRAARIIGVIADITSYKNAEETRRIEQERKRLESIILSLTEAVIILGADGRVISMNPAAMHLHEFDGTHRVPATLEEFVESFATTHPDGRPMGDQEWPAARALNGEMVTGIELRATNLRTGQEWLGSYGAAPVFDENGRVIMAVISIRDITSERAATEDVKKTNATLHVLTGQLLRLQDDERKRIARELHDGTVQVITAMAMNLLMIARSPNVIGDGETRRLITDAQELAKRASRELRTLSYLLHPPELDELGLVAALRSWADGFSHRTGIRLEVTLDDPGRLNQDAETALFRIAQEALANVQNHSRSNRAELLIVVSGEEIRLEVRDFGCGVPPEVLARTGGRIGVGILGMRERARQLGGTLEILSAGSGTTVRATFPQSRATPCAS